jgi:DegV family protein with EDD domain
MPKYRLITDSSCDIPEEFKEQYPFAVTDLIINIDNKSYLDRKEITSSEILDIFHKTHSFPKTSTLNIQELMGVLKNGLEGCDHLFYLPISSRTSSEFSYANTAVQELGLEDKITILDSLSLCCGNGIEAIAILEDFKKDLTVEEIINNHNDRAKRVVMDFTLDNMEALHKGGRCSGLAYLIGNKFHIHPIITHVKGHMEVKSLVRGKDITKPSEKLMENFRKEFEAGNIDLNYPVFIADIDCDERAEKARKELLKVVGDKMVHIVHASGVIVCHTCCETFGLSYVTKSYPKE